jgi:hypothetical protein
MAFLFISHDLNVVRYMSDQIGVMYLGEIVEVGPADASSETRSTRTRLHSWTPYPPFTTSTGSRGRSSAGSRQAPPASFPDVRSAHGAPVSWTFVGVLLRETWTSGIGLCLCHLYDTDDAGAVAPNPSGRG